MSIFSFKKKKEAETKTAAGCCCGQDTRLRTGDCESDGCTNTAEQPSTIQSIKVLGTGCPSCHRLFENAKAAVTKANLSAAVEYITEMSEIMEYGVMTLPAFVINEEVVSAGKVLNVNEIGNLLSKYKRKEQVEDHE